VSPEGMDNQSVIETACGFKYFAECITGAVAKVAACVVRVKAHKLRI
jgi:hypothetical protein